LKYNFPAIAFHLRGILTAEVIKMAEKKKCGCGKKKSGKHEAPESILKQEGKSDIPSDVLGSYTGTPVDNGTPIQDADDL